MDYVRETHDVPVPEPGYIQTDIMTFAGNLSSPIPPPEVLSEFDDIPNILREEESITIIRDEEPIETFEEFARYVMEHLSYDTEDEEDPVINRCIVCGIDMGEDNPRQYCEKTYCPEMRE
jgi:hypothetical protein